MSFIVGDRTLYCAHICGTQNLITRNSNSCRLSLHIGTVCRVSELQAKLCRAKSPAMHPSPRQRTGMSRRIQPRRSLPAALHGTRPRRTDLLERVLRMIRRQKFRREDQREAELYGRFEIENEPVKCKSCRSLHGRRSKSIVWTRALLDEAFGENNITPWSSADLGIPTTPSNVGYLSISEVVVEVI